MLEELPLQVARDEPLCHIGTVTYCMSAIEEIRCYVQDNVADPVHF